MGASQLTAEMATGTMVVGVLILEAEEEQEEVSQ
jgi:hypothetical protein